MTCSLSMTGVTILTKSRYKIRHSGLQDIVQTPNKGFTLKRDIPKQISKKKVIRKKATPSGRPKGLPDCIVKKVSQYRINKKEVSHRIRGFLNQMAGEKMLYFWTVTFPENTNDDVCYILLNKWLTRLRQEKMLREYLWIAERQQNGTIHFHIVINQRMDVKKANRFMRASIMHSINQGEVNYSRVDAMRYNGVHIGKNKKTGRVTNFAKQKNEKSLSNYLTKYVTKNDGSFRHLAWHSSRGYSNLVTSVRFTWNEYQKGNAESLLDNEKMITGEYFTFRRWKGHPPKDLLTYLGLLNQEIQSSLKN